MSVEEFRISTPCIKQCRIDQNYGFCSGCRRTRGEIAAWRKMTEAERRAVMLELPTRPDARSVEAVGDRNELTADLAAYRAEHGDQAG